MGDIGKNLHRARHGIVFPGVTGVCSLKSYEIRPEISLLICITKVSLKDSRRIQLQNEKRLSTGHHVIGKRSNTKGA